MLERLEEDSRIELAALYSPAIVLFIWGIAWIVGFEGKAFNIIMIFVLSLSVTFAETVRIKRRYRRIEKSRRQHERRLA